MNIKPADLTDMVTRAWYGNLKIHALMSINTISEEHFTLLEQRTEISGFTLFSYLKSSSDFKRKAYELS